MPSSFTQKVLACTLVAVGCDNTAEPEPEPAPTPSRIATEEEIATYSGYVDAIDEALQHYQFAVIDPYLSQQSCREAQARYDAVVRPAVGGMIGLGDPMQAFMDAHGGGFVADFTCVPRLMMIELDDHNNVACMWPTAAENRAESLRHANVMVEYVGHVDARIDEMMTGMSGGGWSWHDSMCL